MIRQIACSYLACDGCEASFGIDGRYRSAVELRAAAYADGWRFPPRMLRDGRMASRLTNDVCPDCIGDWELMTVDASERGRCKAVNQDGAPCRAWVSARGLCGVHLDKERAP